jgi:hypothetical protein
MMLACYDKTKEGAIVLADDALLFVPSSGGQYVLCDGK